MLATAAAPALDVDVSTHHAIHWLSECSALHVLSVRLYDGLQICATALHFVVLVARSRLFTYGAVGA